MYDEPTSPLFFGRDYVEALLEWSGDGLPIIWAPCPMSGATAPITLAGNIVTGMAESIAGNVLAQLNNPGTPFIFGFVPIVLDMRTSLSSYGAPEDLLLGVAEAQLAQHLGLPLWGTGGCTDSKVLDAQAVIEAAMSLTTATMAGQNLIHDIGLLEGGRTGSLELMVICNEIIAMLKRFANGIEVSDETLAMIETSKVEHGGNFLGLEHTRRHFPKEHRIPHLMDRAFSYETWMKMGGKSLVERANEEVMTILEEHEVEPLPKDIGRRIDEIIEESTPH
jgi:trimethylamine--corrinoid protein Co-methyltransferase